MSERTMLLTEPSRYLPVDDRPETEDRAGGPIAFGRFLAMPAARTLLLDGKPVSLGGRAFDLLIVLLRSRGQVVTRGEIFRHVWPSTTVEESNLRFQMAVLRKALGTDRDRIKTVTGRGYLFAADSDRTDSDRTDSDRADSGRGAPAGRPAVVIIDQDRSVREALQRLLRPYDLRVASFVSVEAFLAANRPAASHHLAPSGAN